MSRRVALGSADQAPVPITRRSDLTPDVRIEAMLNHGGPFLRELPQCRVALAMKGRDQIPVFDSFQPAGDLDSGKQISEPGRFLT